MSTYAEPVTWIAVGAAADVPLWEGRRVTVEGRAIAVFHTDAGFHAVDGTCPHRDGPLQDGLVADDCVTCPLHGWRFSLGSGERIGGGPDDPALEVFPVVVHDGELMLGLAEPLGLRPRVPSRELAQRIPSRQARDSQARSRACQAGR